MSEVEAIEERASHIGAHDISVIQVSEQERQAGVLRPETLQSALSQFEKYGYLKVEGLFAQQDIETWHEEYKNRYKSFLTATNKKDKRPLFTVDITGPFNNETLLVNPLLEEFFSTLLGKDFIVGAVSSVLSFPGAPDQHLHRDATPLFSGDHHENDGDSSLPPYSITMLVPLVDATHETGCTRVWPGSHRIVGREAGLAVGSLDPEVETGAVLLTDGRVLHRGAANISDRLRPLAYMTYHRSWYRDYWGYERRMPIRLGGADYRKMPPHLQTRFSWIRDRYRRIRAKYAVRRMLPAAVRLRLFSDI